MPALRILLLLRGAVSVLFALSKLAPASLPAALALNRNGTFSLVDGLLGLALAFALFRSPRYKWLFGLVLGVGLLFGFGSVDARRLLIGGVALGIGLCLLASGFLSKDPRSLP